VIGKETDEEEEGLRRKKPRPINVWWIQVIHFKFKKNTSKYYFLPQKNVIIYHVKAKNYSTFFFSYFL
jgi:hypothetical protein